MSSLHPNHPGGRPDPRCFLCAGSGLTGAADIISLPSRSRGTQQHTTDINKGIGHGGPSTSAQQSRRGSVASSSSNIAYTPLRGSSGVSNLIEAVESHVTVGEEARRQAWEEVDKARITELQARGEALDAARIRINFLESELNNSSEIISRQGTLLAQTVNALEILRAQKESYEAEINESRENIRKEVERANLAEQEAASASAIAAEERAYVEYYNLLLNSFV